MDLSDCRMLIHELLNKYPYIVPEEAPLIILDSNYSVCMDNNGKDISENQWMVFYDHMWQDCPYTGRSTGAYIIVYQGGITEHIKHVQVPVPQ